MAKYSGRLLSLLLLVFFLANCSSTTPIPTSTPTFTPTPMPTAGSPGIGDPYYPTLGNGGYDVKKYTIVLDVDPKSNTLVNAKTTIEANATERLASFNLDFQGLTVDSVSVNNSAATFIRQDTEMTITPNEPLDLNSTFVVEVNYHGVPTAVMSQAIPVLVGWFHSKDGTINVLTEPDGASTWFPNNNHPRDKAIYRFEVTVPQPWIVAATGSLVETRQNGDKTTFITEMDKPMATYLAAINIGQYEEVKQSGPNGVSIRSYFPTDYPESLRDNFNVLPAAIEFFDSMFGPYPFKEYGVVIANSENVGCDSGGTADETQSLSIHCPNMSMADENVIVHELAHQWFGDSVSLENWQDIWLKEGFATYAEWLWESKNDPVKLEDIAKYNERYFFDNDLSVAAPSLVNLYTDDAYTGGALILQALRLQVGDETFINILKSYIEKYSGGNASTDDFISTAQEISGQDLQTFFDQWLFSKRVPSLPE